MLSQDDSNDMNELDTNHDHNVGTPSSFRIKDRNKKADSVDVCLFGKNRRYIAPLKSNEDEVLNNHNIDIQNLRRLASQGIPDSGCHRAVVWRVLLGLLPSNLDKWDEVLKRERASYRQLVEELFTSVIDQENYKSSCIIQNESDENTGLDEISGNHNGTKSGGCEDSKDDSNKSKDNGITNQTENMSEGQNIDKTSDTQSNDIPQGNEEGVNANNEAGNNSNAPSTTTNIDNNNDLKSDSTVGNMNEVHHDGHNNDYTNLETKIDQISITDNDGSKSVSTGSNDAVELDENILLFEEIRKDVVRTHPSFHFFLEPEGNLGQQRYAAIERILFVWAKLNKGVRYVQGMNEIVGTIFFVLANDSNEEWAKEAEADAYFLFNTLMSEMRDVFVPDLDEADTGIQGRIYNFVTLLSLHDPEVKCHLDDIGIDATFFCIRWLTTLLSREFMLPDTIRIWDSMFASTHKDNFLRYVCVTMVMVIRNKLLHNDFSQCLRLLQSYPATNIDRLLESSRALWIYESQVTLACYKGGIRLQHALQSLKPPPAIIMAYGLSGGVAQSSSLTTGSFLPLIRTTSSSKDGLGKKKFFSGGAKSFFFSNDELHV